MKKQSQKDFQKENITRESGLKAFYSLRDYAHKTGLSDMTPDDINKEIKAVKKSNAIRNDM